MSKANKSGIKRKKPHNHYPAGKTGYVPKGVGINPLSKEGRKHWERK